ncbi:Hint domain-containing protein [uncultured Sulfitobacter sp.]|uniref:Hint domain-containing protein n=1 Tax=uncultured Sulfitobacter sp. TaxID=191468 RepID=UPI0026229CD6|nr:Hint domain-containing protein [uncultured Sulfitobacter sp.]
MANLNGTDDGDDIRGTDEDDVIATGAGNDTISAGAGDDDIFGGDGDDVIDGGDGNDLINGGAGADTMSGGAGADIFYNLTPGDVVDGGEGGPVDYDSLNPMKSNSPGGRYEVVLDSDNPENGTVDYFGADGEDEGSVTFKNIEMIVEERGEPEKPPVVPCFTPGTRIATPRGEVNVEDLKVGDRVITRDNGLQTIRWIGARTMSVAELAQNLHLAPVRIRQGALGNDLPERDMMVSPNHRMLVANDKTALYFEEREVLVAAKHLTGLAGVDVVETVETTYIHLMFDQHEVILSDGTWSESFQPGLQTLAGIGNAQRTEIFELFPELATEEGVERYAAARRSMKRHEAALLLK